MIFDYIQLVKWEMEVTGLHKTIIEWIFNVLTLNDAE